MCGRVPLPWREGPRGVGSRRRGGRGRSFAVGSGEADRDQRTLKLMSSDRSSRGAFDGDVSAMRFGDSFRISEAKAGPAMLPGHAAIDLDEGLENRVLPFFGDALAIVKDEDAVMRSIAFESDADRPASIREFGGVFDDMRECALDLIGIADDGEG